MKFCKRFGMALGSLHVILFFVFPLYASYLESFAPALIGVPVMFFFGFWWPFLVFFAFAPPRLYREPEVQEFIGKIGTAFKIRVTSLSIRIVAVILLWPFTIINFDCLYNGLRP